MRGKPRRIIYRIEAAVKPGMVEEDAGAMAKDVLATHDMVRGWHDMYAGRLKTLKIFGADSGQGIVLKDTIDVVPGMGGIFSLENGFGKRFLTRSRVFTDDEVSALSYT